MMTSLIEYFQTILKMAFINYFQQESSPVSLRAVPLSTDTDIAFFIGHKVSWEERVVLLLALMPHLKPEVLDLFFIRNKELDMPQTVFGGWKGTSHNGFLPTGETAAFILSLENPEGRGIVYQMFNKQHWFYTANILRLEGQGPGEPFLSGKLCVSEEFLSKLLNNGTYHPDYSNDFPARHLTTPLEWKDLVLPYHLQKELNDISEWIAHEKEIRTLWPLDKYVKRGYRCLFYGPPGTGKTLAAALLGKKHGMDVYRIDLSMVVSKYIGETEKNLARIFDRAEHQNWILFFDEADALFGKRSETNSSNDRHANQEVAYLLQRIEDFLGIIVLATNLKDNLDDAFFRRFQSIVSFPVPDEPLRRKLWNQMIPDEWFAEEHTTLLDKVSETELSGGSMINVLQRCALELYKKEMPHITVELLQQAIEKEMEKEGKIM